MVVYQRPSVFQSHWTPEDKMPVTLPSLKRPEPKKRTCKNSSFKWLNKDADFVKRGRERLKDPEVEARRRASLKAAMQEAWADPVRREKMLAGMQAAKIKRLARLRLAMADYWTDEKRRENAERTAQMHKDGKMNKAGHHKINITPLGWEKRKAATRGMWIRKRGFAVPLHLKAQYRKLVYSKKIPAIEAGRILGLIK